MRSAVAAGLAGLLSLSVAQTHPPDIVGTWSTKSNKTLTGPVRTLPPLRPAPRSLTY